MTMAEIDELRARADEAIEYRRNIMPADARRIADIVVKVREEIVVDALFEWWNQGCREKLGDDGVSLP